ncbi:hypothetical protein [Sedimentibacter sp.]|nr:hypothetical protein [Sedimentibacter sp.]
MFQSLDLLCAVAAALLGLLFPFAVGRQHVSCADRIIPLDT